MTGMDQKPKAISVMRIAGAPEVRSPVAVRRRFDQLLGQRAALGRARDELAARRQQIGRYLAISEPVEDALDKLSEKLFGQIISAIEAKLTEALREVLEQPITLKVDREWKRGGVTMSIHVERDGQREDIVRGQGGSVANVLSVGLRLLALMTLDRGKHRRFLVLDEQDCWLRPDLVPRLVKIVYEVGRHLGFQVLMITHHDPAPFEQFADRIYRFVPTPTGVQVRLSRTPPLTADRED
jgi:hypothetical protein